MAVSVAPKDVNTYLSQNQNVADKELAAEWAQLEELYNKRLWHQLTLKLETFVKNPVLQKGDKLVELYVNFLSTFENKINPLSLVEILAYVIQQFQDKQEAIKFLEKTESKVKSNNEAVALCKVLTGQILLEKLNNQEQAKQIIEEVEVMLDNADGVTTVHGRFYLLASRLYRLQGKHAEYYRTALRYLGCIDLNSLNRQEQEQHAFFLGLAALLGEGVYNLGELLAHPVLQSLKGTPNSWLVDLLQAFNAGDIVALEKLKPQWSKVADLAAQELKLRQKISLLCLMEMTFKRQANNRQLTFAEISQETRLPLGEVELLVMKALAQGLVRGAIDQVAGTVNMTWVQPRVLDRTQIAGMVQRLDGWCKDVSSMERLLESRASEILTL
ncbi:26S proteasome non-ATPase regulatory subunit 13 [Apis laboriosa]|uniref:26S proteasome non-ATPase regulatory subunit 13 n=2 Tax=Apis TaxID=7459 RepID=A0A7M7R5V2_APIME|nr:26S proteasome non-ATPase regulatory subunit 13 [Apis laboriosa]XP_392692.2 26S proteasome non-ATPase regulatory subunit 13 [Apis mellifera]KAG6797414.1 26S proteasome non-ATPase regulatory subunit 13 [Apis mellifera caucasica]KAG9430088.1 26S proteasome non-ATPase regulatory subunit 13 [Apis mellifera carnica]|eukprot:XP_392692.2 26S proteasome non-ATPase regulatory subunit 13 [Apis mellifera]